jgi:CheY-like chemotaxis protein
MPKILVVDDEIPIVKIIAYTLQGAGYDVTSAGDTAEALETVRADSPDLILLDVMMPRLDGFRVLEALKTDPATRQIPVVFLTVKRAAEDRQRALGLGASVSLTKPFSSTDLLERTRRVLNPGTAAAG